MIAYRPHKGGLAESMANLKEFETINQMIEHIVSNYNSIAINHISSINVSFRLYLDAQDVRIGWKRTYIVMVDEFPTGFFTDEYEH